MKKLTSLLIFVGLAINVCAQEQRTNLKEAFKADWLIGKWETKNDNGQVSSHTFGWKIQDILMFKEFRMGDNLQSFAIISLDADEDKVIIHSYGNRRTSVGELKLDGDKVIRTTNWKRRKLSKKEAESRIKSIITNQLAQGAVEEEGVPELRQSISNYFNNNRKTSGSRKYTYEKQGTDKLVMTTANKDESGQFIEGDPITYTRAKKE